MGITFSVGVLLGAGALSGMLARFLRLPALTGYLAAGLLLGRPVLDVLPHEHLETLSGPVNDFAMALVLFVLGGQFHPARLKLPPGRMLGAAMAEALLTFVAVAATSWPFVGPRAGLLLGVLAIAVAPATTLVVLREYRASGPLTERIILLTTFSNFLTVVLFEVALLLLVATQGRAEGFGAALPILWDLAGSLLFGLVAGHALILLHMRIGRGNLALPLLTVLFLTIGACRLLDVPYMLAFLVTGAVVSNRSRLFETITGSMDLFAKPAYVAFFVLGGAHLDFAVFAESGAAVGVYVAARTLGKVVGTRFAGRLAGLPLDRSQQAGPGLLCQAGAAIALAGVAGEYDPALGHLLLNVILGAVAVFELAGPVLLRTVAVAAGEVPMGQLLVRATSEAEGVSWWQAALHTLRGWKRPRRRDLATLRVRDIMRPHAASLPADADLPKVLRFADHSPYNHFPVVRPDGRLIGIIPLSELDRIVYDPKVSRLVIAEDLIELEPEEAALPAGAGLREAAEFFQGYGGNTAAVVESRESGRFLGMLPRSEVLLLARSLMGPARLEGPSGAA